MKRLLCALLSLLLIFAALPPALAEDAADNAADTATETEAPAKWSDSQPFGIRNGPRDQKRVAITMDDCYNRSLMREIFDFCQELGVPITFFPLGEQIKQKDAELWKEIAASNCEIGNHTNHHTNMTAISYNGCCVHIYRTQECLDAVLGYHYGMVSLRPPFGAYRDEGGSAMKKIISACKKFGYEHVVLWDVSQIDPEKAKKDVQNGSILLYHARNKDVKCLKVLIPWLIEEGYELVTVHELLDLGDIVISDEPYVHVKGE